MEEFIDIILLAIALAMDAFSVALSLGMSGLAYKKMERLKIGFSFGFFQGLFFILGTLAIFVVAKEFVEYNHYIAATLLAILGIKMIKDALGSQVDTCKHDECIEKRCKKAVCERTGQFRFLTIKLLIIYGTATSIDAFAAGVTYGLLEKLVVQATLAIGLITFVFSYLGAASGMKLKALVGNKANLLGGSILILLAIKSLLQI